MNGQESPLVGEQAPIINEPDRVVLVGEWATEVIYDVTYSGTENIGAFEADFEIVSGHHLADPGESFYQGVLFMALIRRRADGRLFGYPYWKPIAKHAEVEDEGPNGDEHGFEATFNEDYTEYVTGPFYVWLPVEPFTITGYQIDQRLPPANPGADQ